MKQSLTETEKTRSRTKAYASMQIGLGIGYLFIGLIIGFNKPEKFFLAGNFSLGVGNLFSAIGLFIIAIGILQRKTGFSPFRYLFFRKANSKFHYNIWTEMKPSSLRFLALAVFLIFSVIGPLNILMGQPFQVTSFTILLITTIGSGGTAACIIMFGNKPFIMVPLFLFFMCGNMFSFTIAGYIDGKEYSKNKFNAEQELRLSPEEQEAIADNKSTVGITAIFLLTVGYILFILVIGKEGGQRLKLQAEVNVAKTIQDSLIPSGVYKSAGFTVAGKTTPATQVAGDYYDYYELNKDTVLVTISDSSGHGVGAGIHAAMIKSGLGLQMQHSYLPAEALAGLNKAMCRTGTKGMFSTMAYLVINRSNTVTLATAGHPPVLYFNAAEKSIRQLRTPSLGIGISGSAQYSQIELTAAAGDCFLLFTDGLTECTDAKKEQYGMDRLTNAFLACTSLPAEDICKTLIEGTLRFSGKPAPEDDISLVCVKVG